MVSYPTLTSLIHPRENEDAEVSAQNADSAGEMAKGDQNHEVQDLETGIVAREGITERGPEATLEVIS